MYQINVIIISKTIFGINDRSIHVSKNIQTASIPLGCRIFYLFSGRRELLSSVLSLTARINPSQVVKEFPRTKAVRSSAADSFAIHFPDVYFLPCVARYSRDNVNVKFLWSHIKHFGPPFLTIKYLLLSRECLCALNMQEMCDI